MIARPWVSGVVGEGGEGWGVPTAMRGTAEARSGVTGGEQDISAEENRQRRYEIIRRHLFS